MARTYEGNPMFDDPEWEELDSLGMLDGAEWFAFLRKESTNGTKWRQVKVSANGCAEAKANYWMSWDGKKIARSKDMVILSINRPELAKKLRKMLKDYE